jgi:valyl-tRNA synthetase
VVGGVRSTREELGLGREVVGRVRLVEEGPGTASVFAELGQAFRQLTGCELVAADGGQDALTGRYASVSAQGVRALLDLEGLVDVERERARLVSKAAKAAGEAAKARAKLENEGFLAKAPVEVVAEERTRLAFAEAVLSETRNQYRERIGGELPAAPGSRS